MNKVELVKMIKEETGLTKDQVIGFFEVYEKIVKTALVDGDKVPMPGFGTFQMKEKAARSERQGVNPQNPEQKITIAAQPAYKTIELKIPKSIKVDMKQVIE